MKKTAIKTSARARETLTESARSVLAASAQALLDMSEKIVEMNAEARTKAIEEMTVELEVFSELLEQLKARNKSS